MVIREGEKGPKSKADTKFEKAKGEVGKKLLKTLGME